MNSTTQTPLSAYECWLQRQIVEVLATTAVADSDSAAHSEARARFSDLHVAWQTLRDFMQDGAQ